MNRQEVVSSSGAAAVQAPESRHEAEREAARYTRAHEAWVTERSHEREAPQIIRALWPYAIMRLSHPTIAMDVSTDL